LAPKSINEPTASVVEELDADIIGGILLDCSEEDANTTIALATANLPQEQKTVYKRVLLDIWHGMNRIKISLRHALRPEFCRALRDAFFIIDEDDKNKVKEYLAKKGKDFDETCKFNWAWIAKRVKRFVPPPLDLVRRLTEVFLNYGPLVDNETNRQLFTKSNYEEAGKLLKHAALGCFSDPSGWYFSLLLSQAPL
jgi:hypothetical protein